MSERQDKQKRSNYKKISEEVRMTIIDRILDKGHSLKDVATSMNVNMSTCKAIIKVYQEEGRVGKKKKRNKVYNVIETFSFFYLQGDNIEQIGDVKIHESKVSLEKEDNFDEVLKENARARAEELLEQVVAEKKQQEQQPLGPEMQQQLMQLYWMQNGYMQYYHPLNNGQSTTLSEVPVKQEEKEPQQGSNGVSTPKIEQNSNVKLE